MLPKEDALNRRKSRERDITMSLEAYENQFHPESESLTVAHRVHRVKVVRSFMKTGEFH